MDDALVLQGPWQPTAILAALEALMKPTLDELRISVAYTTLGGCRELLPRLEDRVGSARWTAIAKTVVTSTDFGLTEPAALRYLRDEHGVDVRLSAIGPASFHTKVYAFGESGSFHAFVGSANLTKAALTTNGEAGAVVPPDGDPAAFGRAWSRLLDASEPLSEERLAAYEAQRKKAPPKTPPEAPVKTAAKVPASGLTPLASAVEEEAVDPAAFGAMWVEAGSMSSSGSHSQLELPRRGHRFFGLAFEDYDEGHHTLGHPRLSAGGIEWTDRPLTWHGNNRMERINLPTPAQGGFAYMHTAVLFRRAGDGFQLSVAPWESEVAASWRAASRERGSEYRLGRNSPRTCGFF